MVYDQETDYVIAVMLDEYGEVKEIQSFYFLTGMLGNRQKNDFNSAFANNNVNLGGGNNMTSFPGAIAGGGGPGFNKPNEFYNEINGESEYTKLTGFFSKFQPELIVVSANNIKTKQLKENITTLALEVLKDSCFVTFGDVSIPYIFATSSNIDSKYRSFNISTRIGISLGRFKQNPLAEILQLWNDEIISNGCLRMNLHPLQKNINQSKLIERLEIEAIRVVNNIGVDLNRIKDHNHLKTLLNFISGLGPRKAAYFIEKVLSSGELICRQDISLIFGPRVLNNLVGFIIVKQYTFMDLDKNIMSENQNLITSSDLSKHACLLELTRIHPESYFYARGMINSSIEKKTLNENEKIELVFRDPSVLQEIETADTIKKQEEKGNFAIKYILDLIMSELYFPFKDPRKAHQEIGELDLFKMMTKESPVEPGSIVLAKSIKVGRSSVFCKLENDLEAVLYKNDIFDEAIPIEEIEERMNRMYPKNSLFYARVKNINKLNFKVEIQTRPSKMASHEGEVNLSFLDDYFKIEHKEDLINSIANNNQEQNENKRVFHKRNINHPNYKNYNYIQCVEHLKNKEIGDYIFRPSTKSTNIITLSWKYYGNIISHIPVIEEEKAKGANIGSKFRISSDFYFSLNEIVDRFLNPCKRLILEATNNRKFFYYESIDEMETKLKDDKTKDPMLIHYVFTISPAYPQFIILAYIPKMNQVIKEFMKVKPQGFFFHNNYFLDLNDVAKYFKENYSKQDYRNYLKSVKPPGEEKPIESFNNYGSSYIGGNYNNINSGKGRNDYASNYVASKRGKSPNTYSSMVNYGTGKF